MKPLIPLLVSIVLLVGCNKQERRPATLNVTPGLGIPGVATVDMSIRDLRKTVDDLEVTPYPSVGLPGQVNSAGDRLRLPWEKATSFYALSRSLGLIVSTHNEDRPVHQLTFLSDPAPLGVDSNTWFTGQLSGSVSFAGRRRVARSEIIAVFGEPTLRRGDFDSNAWQLVVNGTSVGVRYTNGNEELWYPTNGVSFFLRDNQVTSFDVYRFAQARATR